MDLGVPQLDRRSFLAATLGSVCLAAACGDRSGLGRVGQGNQGTVEWINPLRVPPLDTGTIGTDGVRRFVLDAGEGDSELLAGHSTRTWGYNGSYLGPTLRASSSDEVLVEVRNNLDETTTVHWHGMRLPAVMDGTPHQPIAPGKTWTPTWKIDQPAATLWYHPHPHGDTATHVYRGLAGMWIIDDEHSDEVPLPHDYGVDDVPIIVQDRDLAADGRLLEDRPVAFWGLMGNQILVNGSFGPFLDVTTRTLRMRILNGSNARVYNLRFDDDRRFHVVGTDCGLLAAPVAVDEITLSPAERAEILVEFDPDDRVVLTSRSGGRMIDDGDYDIVQFRAAPRLADNGPVPTRLPGTAPLEPSTASTRRRFILAGDSKINSKSMDMTRVDEVIPLGAIEQWEVWAPGVPHNFHIHDAAFNVVDIDGKPPPGHLSGLKDTVFLPAGATATLAVGFGNHADPDTPYMYHCHILRHEDQGMMGQFTVVEPEDIDRAPRSVEAPQNH